MTLSKSPALHAQAAKQALPLPCAQANAATPGRPAGPGSSPHAAVSTGCRPAPATTVTDGPTITFSEFPVGTHISKQYQSLGIDFGGDNPFITTDNANPDSPELSGTPLFNGVITGTFVDPKTGEQATVTHFQLDAGYFDNLHSTQLSWYDSNGNLIDSETNSQYGFQHFSISSTSPAIGGWRIAEVATENNGFGVDNVAFSQTADKSLYLVDPYLLAIPADNTLAVTAVAAAAVTGKYDAGGLMADGASAAIAVFETTADAKVTFSATNGATVAAYDPSFLTQVSGSGAASVEVAPTLIDGKYYALALVIGGTPPKAELGGETTVSAVSTGYANEAAASMLTVPTPEVFIHGLWGNAGSLDSTIHYISARATPFQIDPFLVTPICYSVYLNFDAASDPVPGAGTGCEMTSAQSLDKYFANTLYKELDANHWVGGRVDAIVHSMGGLVARHYESTASYKSIRNRNLGAFRDVVTLDTPETGSALATYLDDSASRKLEATVTSNFTAYLLWKALCGLDSSTTIETCFFNNSLPLAYTGQPLSTGAVASLIPGGHSIASAPAPTVFNTAYGKWYAIYADYHDGDSPASLLRDLLDTVIAATYAKGQTPPTLTSTLGTKDSDVIVTVASQTSTAPAAQTKEFKDLQHTPAPSSGYAIFPKDSNASVTASSAVNAQAAYWLGLQTTATPAAEEPSLSPSTPPAGQFEGANHVQPSFLAPERLTAVLPSQSVGLGQPFELPLNVTGGKIADIFLDQSIAQSASASRHPLVNWLGAEQTGSGRPKILSQRPGQAVVEVVPLQTGPLTLRVNVLFGDGGLAQRDYELNVVPSQRGLTRFSLNNGFHHLALVLEDNEQDRQAFLHPVAQYAALRYPIRLENSEQLTLSVDRSTDRSTDQSTDQPSESSAGPVLRVDPNGLITALNPGRAVIAASFDGIEDTVTVDVYTKATAPSGYRLPETPTPPKESAHTPNSN